MIPRIGTDESIEVQNEGFPRCGSPEEYFMKGIGGLRLILEW